MSAAARSPRTGKPTAPPVPPKRRLRLLGLALLIGAPLWLAGTGGAQAFETVFSGGDAKACMAAARQAADTATADPQALETCSRAIAQAGLHLHDLAATYVNRGIVALCRKDYPGAERDFDTALELIPDLGGAHLNRGAVLIAEGRFQDGITALDRSIDLGTPEPERAFYDRALARERLDDVKGAYYDLLKAAQLNPKWDLPAKELAYFKVTRAEGAK